MNLTDLFEDYSDENINNTLVFERFGVKPLQGLSGYRFSIMNQLRDDPSKIVPAISESGELILVTGFPIIKQVSVDEARQYQLRATKEDGGEDVSQWYSDEETVDQMQAEVDNLGEYGSTRVIKRISGDDDDDDVTPTLEKKCKGDYTKANESIMEGVDDPSIFKAVFLAGGPGSGKSFIVGKTGLKALGYKVVNSDDFFERGLEKAGLEPIPANIFSKLGQKIRGHAKEKSKKQMDLYLQGRLGLVIDGTGKDFAKIKKKAQALEKFGYETSLILVNTDLDTALDRNRNRKRKLKDDEAEKMWRKVQNNIGKFQSHFKDRFLIVDNTDPKNTEKETLRAYKDVMKWSAKPPKNPIAKAWIKAEKGLREDVSGIPALVDELMEFDTSLLDLMDSLMEGKHDYENHVDAVSEGKALDILDAIRAKLHKADPKQVKSLIAFLENDVKLKSMFKVLSRLEGDDRKKWMGFIKKYLKTLLTRKELLVFDDVVSGLKLKMAEDVELDEDTSLLDMMDSLMEGKLDYKIYHKTHTDAVSEAKALAERQGYEVDNDHWTQMVNYGKRKPSEGKTNRYSIRLIRNGKEVKNRMLYFQVYGMRTGYELNAYVA